MKKDLDLSFDNKKPKTILKEEPMEERFTLDFPHSVMTGVAGDFAQIYGSHLEPPDHFFYMAYLTIFGLYISDKLYLESQRKPAPRFYTILLGESADTRKSTAAEETEKHFTDFLRSSGDNSFNTDFHRWLNRHNFPPISA